MTSAITMIVMKWLCWPTFAFFICKISKETAGDADGALQRIEKTLVVGEDMMKQEYQTCGRGIEFAIKLMMPCT